MASINLPDTLHAKYIHHPYDIDNLDDPDPVVEVYFGNRLVATLVPVLDGINTVIYDEDEHKVIGDTLAPYLAKLFS